MVMTFNYTIINHIIIHNYYSTLGGAFGLENYSWGIIDSRAGM